MVFDVGEPLVQFQALVEPLVLEAVESVEKTHVHHVHHLKKKIFDL